MVPRWCFIPCVHANTLIVLSFQDLLEILNRLMTATESFLARIDAIDQQLREAQEEQEAQFELERAAIAAAGAESSAVLVPL